MKKIVVCIPAYNEAATIGSVIKQIPDNLFNYKIVILVVDDGSEDETAFVSRKLGATVISHIKNMGVGKAFQTGVEAATKMRADIFVNIDADGQFDPSEISKLVSPIIFDGFDFVSADRFASEVSGKIRKPTTMPRTKYLGNLLMSKLISFLAGQQFNDVSCGFRAYSRHALLSLNLMGKFTYTQESFLDLASKNVSITTIPISVKYFPDRKSRVAGNLFVYVFKTLKIIIRSFRDYRPMLLFLYLSMPPLVLSIGAGAFLINHYFKTGQFTPYKILGFMVLYLSTLAFSLLLVGFVADMFVRLRVNQDKLLLIMKEKINK